MGWLSRVATTVVPPAPPAAAPEASSSSSADASSASVASDSLVSEASSAGEDTAAKRVSVRVSPTKRPVSLPLAPLHDIKPGGGEGWLFSRWVKWSVEKLEGIDKATADAIPEIEKNVKSTVGAVAAGPLTRRAVCWHLRAYAVMLVHHLL
jgi:hypothetical protein